MQCLEDNDPDVKENELKTLERQANEEKISDITKIMSINENMDKDFDGSSSTEESVINLKLSSASTRTLIGRTSSIENDEENKQNEQNNEEYYNSISREIVNINLNEDVSNIEQNDTFINDSKQITKFIDDIPRALNITETDNLQDVCCTRTSKKSIKFVSYTNLEYDIVESKSLCTLASVNKSVNNSAKTIFRQGDIINVNTAQIKTLFNTYRKPFEMNNHSDLGIRENRAIATNLKNIVSELASSFSISSDSKKGSFSSSNNYNSSEISQTTLTTSNAPNILIINSSAFFNQIYLESENKFERQHENAIVIDENKQEIDDRKDAVGIQKNNESEKFSFRNKSEVATVSVNVKPDLYKKKHIYSESNMQKDYRLDLTRITCMKSVMSGTEDIFDHEENKLKITKNELWETLILALDITAKRLEDTLSEKIVSKVNKSLNILSKSINLPTLENADLKAETKLIGDIIKHGKVLNIRRPLLTKKASKLEIDACLQCDIVSTSFIDEHMQKYKLEKAKNQSLLKETKIAIDNLGGLAPSKKRSLEITAKDSPIILTKIPTGKKREFHRFKSIIRNSFRFLIENALVIISVPSFLFVLFLLYGVILLAMKPW